MQEDIMEDITSLAADYLECPLHWLVGSNKYFPQFRARLGDDTDERDVDGNTLLHAAATSQMNNRRIVTLLIDWGADVNSVNEGGNTPLHLAVCSRNLANVHALLGAGAYVNPRDFFGRTALHLSVCKRHSRRVFPFPISYCDMSIVERLLRHPRILVNKVGRIGETPLLWAVRERNVCAVRVLLRKGADPNISNRHRQTPLHLAFSPRHVSTTSMAKIALTLLKNGAGIYCLDNFQLTPIDILLDHVLDESMLVFAVRCLIQIAFRYNVNGSLRSKLRPIPHLDHCLNVCCAEVALMKELVICDYGNLHDFALGCFPMDLADPVEEVYRPVVEMLLVFRLAIYHKFIARHLSRSSLDEVLRNSLCIPYNFELEPNATRQSLFREIQLLYFDDERLKMRLQRFAQ